MVHDAVLDEVLATLPADVRERMRRMAVERRLAREQVLFRAGDAADGLYVVLAGRIRVSRPTHGHVEMLHTEIAGGVLGEIPVFGGVPYPATAVATEPSRCARLPASAIETLLRESPEFCRYAIHRLATRAQVLLTRIDELTALTITTRVARHFALRAQQSEEFTLGMSQAALAEDLGSAREVVVRAIRSLVTLGAIRKVGRSRYATADQEILRELAAGPR